MIDVETYRTNKQRIEEIDDLIRTKKQEIVVLNQERGQKIVDNQELEKDVINTNLNSQN